MSNKLIIMKKGPFWCAQGNIEIALNSCMKYPELIPVSELITITYNTELTGTIDRLSNLKGSNVYLFSGVSDTVVVPGN